MTHGDRIDWYAKFKDLSEWLFEKACDGYDIDAADAQEKLVELGAIALVHVDKSCGDNCICADFGDPPYECYRLTFSKISPPIPPLVGEKQGSADADLRSPAHSPVLGGQGAGE